PAAQHAGQLVNLLFPEHERTEHGARFVFAQHRGAGEDFIQHRLFGIESAGAMLAEVADLRVVPKLAFALLKLDYASQNFEKRGLAGAVRPYEDGLFPALDGQVEAAVNLV